MRVNLNQIANTLVPDYRHNQFVDNHVDLDLPPLYRGALVTLYPSLYKENVSSRKLRRYIFKYNANGTFDFLAARKGQRNGGNNVKIENSQINVTITNPADNFSVLKNRNFTISNNNLFVSGSRIRIIKVNQRFLWQERPFSEISFETQYYSDPTDNALQDADKQGDVNWYQSITDSYVIANNSRVEYYNNNTLAGLNSWPIKNEDTKVKQYMIQDNQFVGTFDNTLVNETRPEMLDDAYLQRCFCHTVLNSYDTVFVEVSWKEYTNRSTLIASDPVWVGEGFTAPALKGRIYRVGKLVKSNPVNEYDIVSFAQRTRIKTTKSKRGGNTVYL